MNKTKSGLAQCYLRASLERMLASEVASEETVLANEGHGAVRPWKSDRYCES
jgi:hypothetical protein